MKKKDYIILFFYLFAVFSSYRIVMAKHIQINLTTREMTDVKFVKDDSTDSFK